MSHIVDLRDFGATMSQPDQYRQCLLERPAEGGGFWQYVAWVPIQFGKQGKYIQIKNKDGSWHKWFVKESYSVADSDFLNIQRSNQRDYEDVLEGADRREYPKSSRCNC